MAKLVIPNCVLVTLHWTILGIPAVNVLGGRGNSPVPVDQTLANTIGAAIKSSYQSTLAPQHSNGTALASVGLRDINTANKPEFLDTGASSVGADLTDPLPRQTAMCITLRTAGAGKSFRGRVYLGGFAEAANTSASATTAAVNAAIAFITGIQTALNAQGIALAVLSRPEDAKLEVTVTTPAIPAKLGFATPVLTGASGIVSRTAVWETQRRRTR